MEMKGSKTEKNLMKAFAGESQARNRYTYYASKAREEGLMQIAAIFQETADQEKEHAKRFFSMMKDGEIEITAAFPAGPACTTLDNLKAAADGERFEWTELYLGFVKTAREEGFEAVAILFEKISVAEKQHEARYRALWKNLSEGHVFKRNGTVTWRCLNCGYLHEGPEAPKQCPACAHPQGYFEVLGANY